MFVLGSFKKGVKTSFNPKDVYIDNMVFRLHYRITMWFLIACVLIVGSREFIKEHINCISEDYLKNVINTYCFISTTFTVIRYHNVSNNDHHIPAHPGVGPYVIGKDPIIRHAYYQWVPFVLFAQALMFYVPYLLWKNLENGRMAAIVGHIKTSPLTSKEKCEIKGHKIDSEDGKKEKTMWLKEAYLSLSRFRVNRDWAKNLILCEFLNVVNIILQIILTDKFLKGNFLELGINLYNNKDNTLDMVFPKVTKCIFHKYGSTGTVQIHDTICVMGLNIINEKIYCVLWYWFLGLFIVTVCGLIWRMLTFILHRYSPAFNKWVWGELSPGPSLKNQDIIIITRNLCFSDWLFLYYLGKNINGTMFRNMVSQISETLQNEPVHKKDYLVLEQTPLQSRKGSESFC